MQSRTQVIRPQKKEAVLEEHKVDQSESKLAQYK
jgi:hypothetical protein